MVRLVWILWLWYFLIILTYVLVKKIINRDEYVRALSYLLHQTAYCYMCGSRGGGGTGGPDPPEKSQKYRVSWQYCPGSPEKITRLQSQHSMLGHYRSASETPFKFTVLFGSSFPSSKKMLSELDILWQSFLDPRMLPPSEWVGEYIAFGMDPVGVSVSVGEAFFFCTLTFNQTRTDTSLGHSRGMIRLS